MFSNKSISSFDSTEVFFAQEWFCKHLKLKEEKAQCFQWPPISPDVDNKLFESKSLIKVMNFVLEAEADQWENHGASKFSLRVSILGMSSSKVEATTFGYYETGSEEPAWMYWLTNVFLDTQPGRMMETLFLRPKIGFALFSVSLHLCQNWSKWEINKGGGEHWNMSGRTIPLKHDIRGKIISL